MGKRHEIKVGDKVDLFLEKPPYYRTVIEEMKGDTLLYVSIPSYRGISIVLHEGEILQLYYFRETGRYCVDVLVKRIGHIGNVPVAELEIASPPRKEQRRLAYRVAAKIKTAIYLPPDGDINDLDDIGEQKEIAYTRDISETGVMLATKEPYNIGDILMLELFLPLSKREYHMLIAAIVRRLIPDEDTEIHKIGIEFLNLTEGDRELLAKYIFAQQQRIIRQRRLVEEE